MSDTRHVQPYVQNVLDRLSDVSETPDGWLALCPCPDHSDGTGDHNPSLRITVGSSGQLLLHCRVGCTFDCVLGSIDLGVQDLYPAPGEVPQDCLSFCASEDLLSCVIDGHDAVHWRHQVYELILSACGTLKEAEVKGLQARGVDDPVAFAARLEYGSLTPANLKKVAAAMDSMPDVDWQSVLACVPGVVSYSAGHVELSTKQSGLLVPCRSANGHVAAIKLRRRTDDKPKYLYLSGNGSPSVTGVIHHPASVTPWPTDRVYVTEGEIKADLVSHFTGRFCYGVPGVPFLDRLLPLYLTNPPGGKHADEVCFALDWHDVTRSPAIAVTLQEAMRLCKESGVACRLATWPEYPQHKGFDDLLAAGGVPTILDEQQAEETLEGITGAPSSNITRVSLSVGANPAHKYDRLFWEPLPFPTHVLPAGLDDFVRQVSSSTSCPEDFVGLPLLTLAGAAVGVTRRLEVRHRQWIEYPCLYSCLVAPPGTRKSPALRALLGPIYARQKEAVLDHERDDSIPLAHYLTSDYTTEGITHLLKSSPRGILLFRDELSGWVCSDNQYRGGKGADRQYWLQVWTCESIKTDRKSSGSSYLNTPFLSILGAIQPDLVSELKDPKGREDGFVHRILFAYPKVEERPRGWVQDNIDQTYIDLWVRVLNHLYSLGFEDAVTHTPASLKFTPDAMARWVDWYVTHEQEMYASYFPGYLRGVWSKAFAYCARIALILSLLRIASMSDPSGVTEQVELSDVEGAIEVIGYLCNHAAGVYAIFNSHPHDDLVKKLIEFVDSEPGRLVTLRDVMRKLRLATKSETLAVCKRAVDRGLGELVHFSGANNRKCDGFTTVVNGD